MTVVVLPGAVAEWILLCPGTAFVCPWSWGRPRPCDRPFNGQRNAVTDQPKLATICLILEMFSPWVCCAPGFIPTLDLSHPCLSRRGSATLLFAFFPYPDRRAFIHLP